jgi:hypothetical protein
MATWGGGASTGLGTNNPIIAAYEAAYNRARAANESRYNDILGQYKERYSRIMGTLATTGAQELSDTQEAWARRQAATSAGLAERGLSNTTIAPTMAAGNTRELTADLARRRDAQALARTGTDASLSGDTLQFMERRTDAYPDLSAYVGLLQAMQQGGGGGGVRGGGGGGGGASGGGALGAAMQNPFNYRGASSPGNSGVAGTGEGMWGAMAQAYGQSNAGAAFNGGTNWAGASLRDLYQPEQYA